MNIPYVYDINNLSEGDAVLDLGAGIGEFSLFSSRKVGTSGLMIAIEPSERDFETLKETYQRTVATT